MRAHPKDQAQPPLYPGDQGNSFLGFLSRTGLPRFFGGFASSRFFVIGSGGVARRRFRMPSSRKASFSFSLLLLTFHPFREPTMAWAVGTPQQDAAINELIKQQQSDRVVAVVGGAILEDALKNVMISRFRSPVGHNSNLNERLFRVGGALGFLTPKIELAYQLYIFEKPIRNSMFGIADIRNLFAHQLDLSFNQTTQN